VRHAVNVHKIAGFMLVKQ